MMSFWSNAAFEAVKLALQFGGALFIAWKAVKWAQTRYQNEKHWERRLAAYSEITSALGTLLTVLAEWEEQEISRRGPRGTTLDDLRIAYWGARKRLEEAHSIGMLILHPKVADKIKELVQSLARHDDGDHASFFDKIDGEWKLVRDARDEFVSAGRADLQLNATRDVPKNARR